MYFFPFSDVEFETTKKPTEKTTEMFTYENTQYDEMGDKDGQFYQHISGNPGSQTTYSWSSSSSIFSVANVSFAFLLAVSMTVMLFV